MGTRGAWGIAIDGELKFMAYNHWDSYPGGLGKDLGEALHELMGDERRGRGWVLSKARAIRKVDESMVPTDEDRERCGPFTDLSVGRRSTSDWYCLLRKAQGGLAGTLDLGIVLHADGFPGDGLFCEWAYVIDLDRNLLEIYRGFQRAAHETGRFHALKRGDGTYSKEYYPAKLVAEVPFWKLFRGDQWVEQVEKLADPDSDEVTADA